MASGEIPPYKKLYEQLRKHIVDGVYKVGDILPSENELSLINNVTRPTVRKSLDKLAHEGFIRKRQGLGSIVQGKPKGIGILSMSGTTSAIGKDKLRTKTVVKPHVTGWPEGMIFELSEVEIESGCIHFERIRHINGKPVFYDVTYLPNINLPRFTTRNLDSVSLFDVLREQYQLEVTGGEQYIKAMLPGEKMMEYFDIDPGQPVLNLERRFVTSRPDFNFYSMLYCITDNYKLYGVF